MNTQTANRFISKSNVQTDTTRILGYSAGVPNMTMRPKASGLDCNPIKGGEPLLFVPQTEIVQGMYNEFQQRYVKTKLQRYPGEYAGEVKRKFEDNENHGFVVMDMLTHLPYEFGVNQDTKEPYYNDEAYEYFAVVHPRISCEFGLERFVPREYGQDEYQPCPTCRLAELNSEACDRRIFEASVALDSDILARLRSRLISANEAGIRFIQRKVDEVEGDLVKRKAGEHGRPNRNTIDYLNLKMLHQRPPVDQQQAMMNSTADAIAQGMERGMAGLVNNLAPQQPVDITPLKEELEAKALENAALKSQLELMMQKQIQNDAPTEGVAEPVVAKCGDSGGRTNNGEPCKMNATEQGRCAKHPQEEDDEDNTA